MDQRESTRKLANTPLTKSGAQGDASPSAPSVGEKLRQETRSRASWKNFKTIEDWKREFNKHPRWTDQSTDTMRRDKESGGNAFYQAFRKFCIIESKGDSATYQKLLESIFPKKHRDWSMFKTIGDWTGEFAKHPEWAGRITNSMQNHRVSGECAFSEAFRKFCKAEAKGDKASFQKLFESIFPRKRRSWSSLTIINDWKREFDKHPGWADKSVAAMHKDKKSGANAYYLAFRKFCIIESKGDTATYQKLFESIFPKRHRDWSTFKTIGDWTEEFGKHPEWAGRSTSAMVKDKESGARAFYQAFRKFCKVQSKGDSATYQKLLESIFSKKQRDWSVLTTIGDWKKEFDSHPSWADRSTDAMAKDKGFGGRAFYLAFRKFCVAESKGDKEAYQKLFESIFPKRHNDWTPLKTIEDWKDAFDKNPSWTGRSTAEMERDVESGASAFYSAFGKFCKIHSMGDNEAYKKLFETVFPKKHRNWSKFKTLADWKEEFAKHPEWIGRSFNGMSQDYKSGASAFQQTFSIYCRKVAGGNNALRAHLKGQIFPRERLPFAVVPFRHEKLKETEGKDQDKAFAEIDKVIKATSDIYDLRLPSGITIILYLVPMKSGSIWACTKNEWKTFLAEYGLKEKSKHDDARSNASLIDLL